MLALTVIATGCGGAAGSEVEDFLEVRDPADAPADIRPDAGAGEGAGPWADATPDVQADPAGEASCDAGEASGDAGDVESEDASLDAGDTVDAAWPLAPCRRATACGNRATCNLSSGRCEGRSVGWDPFEVLSVYPSEGAPGDFLVIDGAGFGAFTPVLVGGSSVQKDTDENRIVAVRGGDTTGVLAVGGATTGFSIATSSSLLEMQPCGPSDPAATLVVPADPAEIGPWAVGFADHNGGIFGPRVRVYYPATCGGLRKPPAEGRFPFVVFVHGDGYLPLNFEYLARHLASFGFLVAIPENVDFSVVRTGRTSPGDWFAPLAGHETGGDAAIVCHSKGAEYTHDLGLADIRAVVFLGPVYTTEDPYLPLFPIPGLVMGGSMDGAPTADRCLDVYEQLEAPKYMVMVKRGNHGQFLDDKMWDPPSDGSGSFVARNRQHELVQAFTLACLQRAFGLVEAFPDLLDSPGMGDEVTFWSQQ